jgi:hypothetical protein
MKMAAGTMTERKFSEHHFKPLIYFDRTSLMEK